MSDRLPVHKTYKLYVGGAFPRSESGRTLPITDASGQTVAYGCRGSRKDLRAAVVAARKAQPGWAGATAYNRGQVLYRLAEMIEGKRTEFAQTLMWGGASAAAANAEVAAAVDRVVHYAGWTDKFASVLGGQNPVAGPYWNISVPEPVGVVAVVAPADAALLGAVSLLAPAVCAGNACVLISPANAAVVSVLGEACATSDLPGGVVNLISGLVDELGPVVAGHRDVDAVVAAGLTAEQAATLRGGAAENLKRVSVVDARGGLDWHDHARCQGLAWIERTVEVKTSWHPVGS